MNRIPGFVIVVLLFAAVLIAGCSNSASSNNISAQTATVTTNTPTTALYSAGDIVRSAKAGAETGWLILKYDAGTDSYERAFIYRNSDGSWGYRVDSRTENLGRPVLEKVNTVKVTHVDPSLVPQKQPTVAASSVTAAVTSSGAVSATTSPVTTTTLASKPQIKGITPDSGMAGTSVSITDILGDGFKSGASVMLTRPSSENISATNVDVLSLTHMSCTFPLPSNTTTGIWDIIVTNPDGQSARYSNAFTVRVNTNPTITTTTTSSTGGIGITLIDPTFLVVSPHYFPITVQGSNFKDGISCKLTKSGSDIAASYVLRSSETQMQCFFQVPVGSAGAWNLVLTNTDGTTGILTNGFTVNS